MALPETEELHQQVKSIGKVCFYMTDYSALLSFCKIFLKNYTRFFYKQHFYKQRQAKTGKKSSKS